LSRADRLVALIEERSLDWLLVTNLVNVRYVTGFTGTNGACLVSKEDRLFFTDFRYVERARCEVSEFERVEGGRDLLGDMAARVGGRAGFDDAHLSVRAHKQLAEKVGDEVELVPAGGLVEQLREVKEEDELRAMRAAAEAAGAAYEDVRERGLTGRTEREVALSMVRRMEDLGAEGPSFPPIVAAGAHGALPHAEPRDAEIPGGALVVIDAGARVDGYCSDCTRTFASGPLDDDATEVYELVSRAQEQALAAARAGAARRDVDGVARRIIEEAGHGERFGHGLGHGVGLEIHEDPRLTRLAEGTLRAGNTVTIEPGVYLPGRFGIRIEDLVAITEDGPDVLTAFPKELVTVG
jgi:Xaa-Pro aminopeptidase